MSYEHLLTLNKNIESLLQRHKIFDLKNAFEKLHALYQTRGNDRLKSLTNTEKFAYIATRMPATFAACLNVLETFKREYPSFSPDSLLDLGAGPGTMCEAVINIYPSLQSATLIERDQGFINLGTELLSSTLLSIQRKSPSTTWIKGEMTSTEFKNTFDLVTASYSLGELSETDQRAVILKSWNLTKEILIIIEPGTVEGFNTILKARQELIKLGANIIAPCPHQLDCPMTKDAINNSTKNSKWCHFRVRLNRSKISKSIKDGDLGYEDEPFSYVIASREKRDSSPTSRITSHPKKGHGFITFEACSSTGDIVNIKILKRDKDRYKVATKKRWGDSI